MESATDRDRLGVRIGVLGVCGLAALAARSCLAAADLDSAADLGLRLSTIGLVAIAAASAWRLGRVLRRRIPRAAMRLAGAVLCLTALLTAATSVRAVSIDLASLVGSAEAGELPPTTISVGPTGHDVRLSGAIADGAAERLSALLDAHPDVRRIHLTSEGGFADEGDALAEVIARHRLTTYVPDYCVSACTLAFVAGRERVAMEGARLGFHAPYEEGLFGHLFRDDARAQRAVYLTAGLERAFVDHALAVEPDDVWFPDRARLLAAHVVTTFVDRFALPDSLLDGEDDIAGARALVLRRVPALRPLATKVPAALDRMAAWYLGVYHRGRSEGDSIGGLETIAVQATTLVLSRADDATLLDVARYVDRAAEAAQTRDAEACTSLATRIDLSAAQALLAKLHPAADGGATELIRRALDTSNAAPPSPLVIPTASRDLGPRDGCAAARAMLRDAVQRRDAAAVRGRLQAELRRSSAVVAARLARDP